MPDPRPILTVRVDAFQIDDMAILTVKHGQELLGSGLFAVKAPLPRTVEIDFGPEMGVLNVAIDKSEIDPAKVGKPAYPGQHRIRWTGTAEIEDS